MEIKNDLKSTGNSAGVRAENTVAGRDANGFLGDVSLPCIPPGNVFPASLPWLGSTSHVEDGQRGDDGGIHLHRLPTIASWVSFSLENNNPAWQGR